MGSFKIVNCDAVPDDNRSWHDFVSVSREPGNCEGETGSGYELKNLVWNVELNPSRSTMGISSRMVYRCEVSEYFNCLSQAEPHNACPQYAANIPIHFNSADFIAVMALKDPPAATPHAQWVLDKDEIIPYGEYGGDNMEHRLTYICEGPWYTFKWGAGVVSSGGSGFVTTATTDTNTWMWDSAIIMNQTKQGERTKISAPSGWYNDPTYPLPLIDIDTGSTKQKTIKCTVHKVISGLTALQSPTCEIPMNPADFLVGAYANGKTFLDIFIPEGESVVDGRFRLSSESITPYDKRGSDMLMVTREYTYQSDPAEYVTIF